MAKVAPYGICTDARGAVWRAKFPNKRCMRIREGGEDLQRLRLNRGNFAGVLGGLGDST
ncbi:MAG: hypothetical protein ACLQE9_07305 [Roseiarcus sp.]